MAELNDPVETGMPRNVRFGIIAVLVTIVFIWLLPRKTGQNGENDDKGKPAKLAETTETVSDRETERQLNIILNGLSPELVAINSDRRERVSELSQWAVEAFSRGDAATIRIDETANGKWLTGDSAKRAAEAGFSLRDGHHITLAILCGEIVTGLAQRSTEPSEQVHELFSMIVRETQLMPDDHDQSLPGTAFESLLTGRSTAAGRAWALAVLLRQLKLDAVIIEPKSRPESWLIGVILPGGNVLLFDPRLGVPVPSGAEPARLSIAATLQAARENPALLKLLDLENAAYPLSSEDLKTVNVRLVTDSSATSQRMAKLQSLITGSLIEVFDGLGKNPVREVGLADRVIAAGSQGLWAADGVAVWEYPEKQMTAFIEPGAEGSRAWRDLQDILLGPVSLQTIRIQSRNESEPTTKTVVQRGDYPLRRVRVIQLSGRYADALAKYLPIRTAASRLMMTADPELQQQLELAGPRNAKAADLATFWSAACQSRLKPELVSSTIDAYLRFFKSGEMTPAIPELLATSLEAAGKLDEAIALLERGGSRRTPRQSILLKLWMLRKGSATSAESGASSPKAGTPETSQKPVAPTAQPGAPEPPKPAPSADPPTADSDRPPAPPVAT